MSSEELERVGGTPLLYYRTEDEIEAYMRKPVKQKLQWLQTQMEFFHKAMPDKSKTIRDRLFRR